MEAHAKINIGPVTRQLELNRSVEGNTVPGSRPFFSELKPGEVKRDPDSLLLRFGRLYCDDYQTIASPSS